MAGTGHEVGSPEARKRMLVAASELNRAQLGQEWVELTAGLRTLTGRAKSLGSMASVAGLLAAGLAAWRRGKPAGAKGKSSPWPTILKIAGAVSSLWWARRVKGRDREQETLAPHFRTGS